VNGHGVALDAVVKDAPRSPITVKLNWIAGIRRSR